MSLFTVLVSLDLSPSVLILAGCLSSIVSLHMFPSVLVVPLWVSLLTCEPCGVQLSACLSLHVFPTLSSGVRLLECLFCVFTCLSSCVSRHVSPNLSVSKLICLQSSVCLSEWWCPALSPVRLCVCVLRLPSYVSHLLSRTSFVSEAICLQSYVCLSGGVLF